MVAIEQGREPRHAPPLQEAEQYPHEIDEEVACLPPRGCPLRPQQAHTSRQAENF